MAPRPSLLGLSTAAWLFLATFAPNPTLAHPFPKDDLHAAGYGYLMPRECNEYCGYNNMFCCDAGTQCFTADGIAGCSSTDGGGWARYTTTWTLTQTFTRTYNSYVPAGTAPPGTDKCVPPEGSGQIACGNICCANWQYCAYDGQCMANIGGGGGVGPAPTQTHGGDGGGGGNGPVTTGYSAPWRVTSGTATATGSPTNTADDPSHTSDGAGVGGDTTSGSGLSGGAIAGIVIGTIAGVALLLLICACCVVRGLWHSLLALLGLGKKKETETVIEEERYHRHGSASHRNSHGSWYGGAGGGRPSSAGARKEKSKGAGLLGLGAALGTIALLLGLRRDKKKKEAPSRKSRSDISSSYWSDSYTATSPSSRSSDRRTRHSRHSRAPSRVTRTTHTHTRVSRSRGPSVRSQRSPRP